MPDATGAFRAAAALSVGGLGLVVGGVGALAVVAELSNTWTWLFRMERAIDAAAPVVVGLAFLAVVACAGVVLTAE
ncbi:MAG: hypothetical protein ABEJ61_08500 [Haloferacaceae archaeon]